MNLDTFLWAEFHFLRPWWFLAIIPLAFVLWRSTKQTMNQKGWEGVIDKALLPHVLISREIRSRKWPKILVAVTGLLSIIALAGPVWEQLPKPVFRNDSALVIALDLSRSMDAGDLKPSRLVRARFKIADLLKQRKDGQTALLVYADDAYSVTPLTDDTDTILSQLKALTTDLMPQQGSRADRAMLKARDLLKQAGARGGDVLLISDGVNKDRDSVVAREVTQSGYRIHIFGIGTKEGAPIPDLQGGYFKDSSGNIVIPELEEKSLKVVAIAGGGIYQRYVVDDQDVDRLTLQFDKKSIKNEKRDSGFKESDLKSDQWHEEGPFILLLIIPFAAFAFRKGYMVILVFFITGFLYVPESMADETTTTDLWQRPDQKAQDLLHQGEAGKAAELFEDLRWKGSAQYQAGEYESALKTWESLDDIEIQYNKGNALAKMGKLEEALDLYKQALQEMPEHEDAQYNYDQVKKALEEQQKQEQDQQENQKGDQEKKSEEGGGGEDNKGERSESDNASKNDQQQSSEKEKNEEQSDQQNESGKEQQTGEDQASGKQQGKKAGQDNQDNVAQQGEQNDSSDEESQQAVEAALRAIPDDPGGLLRRKFKYQYQRQQQAKDSDSEEQQW